MIIKFASTCKYFQSSQIGFDFFDLVLSLLALVGRDAGVAVKWSLFKESSFFFFLDPKDDWDSSSSISFAKCSFVTTALASISTLSSSEFSSTKFFFRADRNLVLCDTPRDPSNTVSCCRALILLPAFDEAYCMCCCNNLPILVFPESKWDALEDIVGEMSGFRNVPDTYIWLLVCLSGE